MWLPKVNNCDVYQGSSVLMLCMNSQTIQSMGNDFIHSVVRNMSTANSWSAANKFWTDCQSMKYQYIVLLFIHSWDLYSTTCASLNHRNSPSTYRSHCSWYFAIICHWCISCIQVNKCATFTTDSNAAIIDHEVYTIQLLQRFLIQVLANTKVSNSLSDSDECPMIW